jgi:hypothetical protein
MKKPSNATILVLILIASGLVTLYITQSRKSKETNIYVRLQQPKMLTYDELVALGTSNKFSDELRDKLHSVTTTPFLSNEAYYNGAKPHRPKLARLGNSLRLVMWNIERGLQLDGIKLLFTNTEEFLRQAKRNEKSVAIALSSANWEMLST